MTNDDIVRLLRLVESEVPVERWVIRGIHVWPLVRAQVMIDNYFMFHRANAKRTRRIPRIPLGPLPQLARDVVGYARTTIGDRAGDDRIHEADVLLYSDGISFLRLQGTYYDRFCDPLRERLSARGATSLKVTPLGRYHRPRHSPSVLIQPRLDMAHVRGIVRSRLWAGRSELEGWDDFVRTARGAFPSVRLRDASHFDHAAEYILAFESVHERILDRVRPRVAFVVSYYGAEAMALLHACHRRGIVTVDVQHGCINDSHWAYAHWSRLPEGGFQLLPRYFWVWSETEATTIRAWSERSNGAHAPVVGGNLFLDGWRDGSSPLVRAVDERIDAIGRSSPRADRRVLYTANGFETDAQLGALCDAVSRSREQLFWWVRVHPAVPGSRGKIEAALASSTGHYFVDPAELPLYGVLRHMSAHVTESSTSVIEAAELGVPTVLLARDEATMYQDHIERGWAVVLGDGEDLAARVSVLVDAPRPASASPERERTDPLDLLLGSRGAASPFDLARPSA